MKIAYRDPFIGSTKSEKSCRMIPVSLEYRPHLRYLRFHGGESRIWENPLRDSGLFTVEEFRRKYKKVMSKVPGVPYRTPHSCRHTYITILESRRVPMELIAALAGHQELSTTMNYTHISLDTLRSIVDALDRQAGYEPLPMAKPPALSDCIDGNGVELPD